MHLKRQKAPKTWGVPRKGTAYVVRPQSDLRKGIPLLIVLRDIMKLVKNKKELKKVLHSKKILLNGKEIRNEKNSILLFDVITIVPSSENYKLILSDKGKFSVEKITEKEAEQKVSKIVNKKILKGKKIQLNLSDGRNVLSNLKCRTNDSVIIDFKENKIKKCLELKEKARALVVGGKHIGKKGTISKIDTDKKIIELETEDKNKINVLIKHLVVVE